MDLEHTSSSLIFKTINHTERTEKRGISDEGNRAKHYANPYPSTQRKLSSTNKHETTTIEDIRKRMEGFHKKCACS